MLNEKMSIKGYLIAGKNSFKAFGEYNITKLAASLAYYTVFSMAPLLILIISLAGFFFGEQAAEGKVVETLSGLLGQDTAIQLQEIIRNASLAGKSSFAAIISGAVLLFSATTVFAEIQDSINKIWSLKAKPKKGWLKMIKNRILSFSLVVTLGFLLLVSLTVSTILDAFGDWLKGILPDTTVVLLYIINLIISLGVITILFALVFKLLPDAMIKFRQIWPGAITTAILFLIGKFVISFYIGESNVGSTYGAAGSLVILLLWVYYSAIILYFGAAFTRTLAEKYGKGIQAKEFAIKTRVVELKKSD